MTHHIAVAILANPLDVFLVARDELLAVQLVALLHEGDLKVVVPVRYEPAQPLQISIGWPPAP